MTEDELTSKFMTLSSPLLGQNGARRVLETIHNLENVKDVHELTALLSQATLQHVA